ncbi:MAG: amidase family protein, partial [Albidovulum sp.]
MDLTGRSATHLSKDLASGAISANDLMAATLAKIDAVNPAINAIVSRRPRAELLAEAADCDKGPNRGPLHGLPIAIKDLVATKGLRT